jgi:signal transduction histidine kinase/ActR/RegA family two-component response regulator
VLPDVSDDAEDERIRSLAQRNASAIVLARQRAKEDLLRANDALESRTDELVQTLSLMQATFEATADGLLVTDEQGRVKAYNRKFLEIWSLSEGSVAHATHADLVRSVGHLFEQPDLLGDRIAAVYRSGDATLDTLSLRDGRSFERFSCPQVVDGRAIGRVWSYRDVTARRQAEEALRDEARVLDLLNQTGSAVASTLDLATLLQTVTDAGTQLSGAEFGAFFYNTVDDHGESYLLYALSGAPRSAFDRFGLPRATPMFGPTFNGEAPVRCDDVLLDPRYGKSAPHHGMPPGHLPVRSYLAVPVRLRHGETIGGLFFGHREPAVFDARAERIVVGIAAQASIAVENARVYEEARRVAVEKDRLVEVERAARAEIDRVSRLKDEFLATLSHELRTPLTAILGWAKVLLLKRDDAASVARGLEAIARNAKAQARLIEDLLDMNRIISGKVRLEVQPSDLASVVEAALESVRPSAEAKSLALRVVVDPAAGPVIGDPNRLQQVVWNLLTNAVKFTPRGGSVDVQLRRVDSQLEVIVRDTGIGIEPHFLPQVFDRFRQADASTTRAQSGLGLGLSIAKQLTELHGGTLRASSDGLDRGATFVLSLPLSPTLRGASGEHPAASVAAAAGLGRALDLSGVRILVVDDEADARQLVEQLLRDCRAEVHTAASASEGLTLLGSVRPDLLLSDIGMPECDGYQFIQQVRQLAADRGGKTPAIALTAFARTQDRVRTMIAGYQVHLSKPVEPQELLAAVGSLAGRLASE